MVENFVVAFGVGVLLVIGIAFGLGALKTGEAARKRATARSGNDPADNWFNNGLNRWGGRHPLGISIIVAAFVVLGVFFAFLRVST